MAWVGYGKVNQLGSAKERKLICSTELLMRYYINEIQKADTVDS